LERGHGDWRGHPERFGGGHGRGPSRGHGNSPRR
jgi:hypothetical protein